MDLIKKPEWLLNEDYLKYSNSISEFIKIYDIKQFDNISLDLLRDYYRRDKENCLKLIDELIIRGFKFITEKKSALLPNVDYKIDKTTIFVNTDEKLYNKIDFDRIGISNFIERFNITSDYFFNFIKIDYFLYLNKTLKIEILKDELNKCGFIGDKSNCQTQNNETTLIESVYKDSSRYKIFLEYCKEHKLFYMEQLNAFDFDELINLRGIGVAKIREITEVYNSYEQKFFQSNKNIDEILIEDVFENKYRYNLFFNYCKENNLSYVSQFNDIDLSEIYNIKWLGIKKINEILQIIKPYINTKEISYKIKEKNKIKISPKFYESDINCLSLFDVSKQIISILESDFNVKQLGHLENISLQEIREINGIGTSKIDTFENCIELLKNDDLDYLNIFRKIKKNENFDIYILRCKENYTLEYIGNAKGISRERIRQKETKVLQKFKAYFELFYNVFLNLLKDKECITTEDIINIFKEYDDVMYIKYAIKYGVFKNYVYIKEYNLIIRKDLEKNINLLVNSLNEELSDIFKYDDEIENINEIISSYDLGFLSEESIEYILINRCGYKQLKNYLLKGKETYARIYTFIIKKYFKNGIKCEAKEIDKLKSIVFKEFGIKMEMDYKAIYSRIADENILFDRGKYIHKDYIDISLELLNEIKDYIDKYEEDAITTVDLFDIFKTKLQKQSNINNRYFLHGVLKYYYSSDLSFSKDLICKNGEIKSANKLLENHLKDKGKAVSIQDLRLYFPGWTDIMFSNSVQINKHIVYWGRGEYIHADNIIVSNDDRIKLQEILERAFNENEDYISIHSIVNRIKLKVRNIFKNNQLLTSQNIFYLLNYLFKEEYYFNRSIIYKSKDIYNEELSIYDIYVNKREIINYVDFFDYFNSKKICNSTIYANFKKISERLIQISFNDYIKSNEIQITEEQLDKIRNFINGHLEEKKYISLIGIDNFSNLPNIGIEWTSYLLGDIIRIYLPEYKIIVNGVKNRNNRFDIIVKNESDISDITDLILYIISNEYKDFENLTISKIQAYLISRNIITKSIPNEFYESDKVTIDDFGRIKIEGV